MKQTLTPNQAAHLLPQDENASWSYNGAVALCEYLEPDTELDVVAIRSEFNEYPSAWEAVKDYSDFECSIEYVEDEDQDDFEERRESDALEYLRDNTSVIEFDGGIIIQEK